MASADGISSAAILQTALIAAVIGLLASLAWWLYSKNKN